MGNYEQLKQAVSAVIKKNGNQEITGEIMQNTLLSIISTIGNDATFAGIAVPETNPGTPDQNVFYIASQPGNYSNFGSIKLVDQVLILTNKNGYWVKFDAGITTAAKVAELEERSNANSAYIKLTLQYIGVDMPYMIEVGKKYKVTYNGDISNYRSNNIYGYTSEGVKEQLTSLRSSKSQVFSTQKDYQRIRIGFNEVIDRTKAMYVLIEDVTEVESLDAEEYKRDVLLTNHEPSEISIELHDNKYFDYRFTEQISNNNYNCFKVDVSQYVNQYILLDAYCFGNSYAAKSAITDENNQVIRYVSNEGILPKYVFIPPKSKYLYVSNRKYNDVKFNKTGSKVLSVNTPKLYSVSDTPTLLDTRHFTEIERKNSNKFFHFSLDDFKDAIADIVTNANTYNSIFDNSTFAKLREWHLKFGITVSLYVQRTMSDIPAKFKNDFIYNKDWMKFGYHGNGESWKTATYENGKQWWNDFVNGIMKSIGNYDIIDRVPRNDYFKGTLESCRGERDANCGCLGFLGCDDWSYNKEARETNYYLSDEQSTYLDARDRYYDSETQLCIFKTDFRLEQIQQRWSNVKGCLNYYNSAGGSMQAFDMIVFSHEWNFMQFASDAETIFAWALDKGYRFDFPMNVLLK
jgi:hypothetical protein|uniref:Uncharacterized protein n=1 Tax=Siphoviridae sp. ctzr51 TaxID=2825751 RepID=A0A8S5UN50_9CAUD|nr:MAG TPA: hypothetical protein [Siphoviridae sp. ctzr51]